ncbi:tRNA (adenosine(37)-N6)-dimethylallyltransferase MiaA [Haliea sp. E1-2-M8]|uniref:tRNA (adenosine(37)-N6)-dimethylallyltransferase MiaA n=1 Tax=Haliea sp. E1-2-M8 TaxID=3064706 RepID=UPI002724D4F0|nr:tRNA (adenosine(37)-N6)-dimethylallyltransferase MiaA [Haliea sp. E1-2-M8]MDO8862678.1 tRNA (adenosine(37)-N6)-dimethylallyltransferase MiaA [Haliea sp. E1-2-M8]
MGPTAAGKTELATGLAEALDGELVSVDSALVYRGLDIGSAKPDYPHHLMDIRDPAESYSAADFAADASRVVAQIVGRGRTPILVGGTMLYFRAFLEGLAAMPASDPAIRAQLAAEAGRDGWPTLHARLAQVDPVAAAAIHPHHSQRIGRALEVFLQSGVQLSEWHQRSALSPAADYRVVQLVLCPQQRAELHRRIELRFGAMLAQGFLQEVAALHRRSDLHPGLPAVRAVGYRQLWRHLDGECSLEEAAQQGMAATRQLAKRQLTWLRKWPGLYWLLTDTAGNVCAAGESEDGEPVTETKPLHTALKYLAGTPM